MTCRQCGATVNPSDHFCGRCGARVVAPAAEAPLQPPTAPSTVPPPPTAPSTVPPPPTPTQVAAPSPDDGPSRGLLAGVGIVAAALLVAGVAVWGVASQGNETVGGVTGGGPGLAGTWRGATTTTQQTSTPTTADDTPGETTPGSGITLPTETPTSTSTPSPTPTVWTLTPSIAVDTVGRFENYLKEDQPQKARALATTTFQKSAQGTDWFQPTNGRFRSFEVVRAERLRGGAYRVLVHEVWDTGQQDFWFTVVPFNGRAYVNAATKV